MCCTTGVINIFGKIYDEFTDEQQLCQAALKILLNTVLQYAGVSQFMTWHLHFSHNFSVEIAGKMHFDDQKKAATNYSVTNCALSSSSGSYASAHCIHIV